MRIVIMLLTAAIVVSFSYSVWSDNSKQEAQQQFTLGKKAFEQSQWESALANFEISYRASPHSLSAYFISYTYMKLHNSNKAIHYAQLALKGPPPLNKTLSNGARDIIAWANKAKTNTENISEETIIYKAENEELVIENNDLIHYAYIPNREQIPMASASPRTNENFDGIKIYFDPNSAVLKQEYRDKLSSATQELLKNPLIKLNIVGNTDSQGSAEYNLYLGERRAKAVMQYLVTLGVNASQLSVISYGKERPMVLERDIHTRTLNRRVDLVVDK
jgi:outer membrane protein OmpA-like peptidoglycan-associated protein